MLFPLLCPQGFLCPVFYYLAMSQRMPALGQAVLWHVGAVLCGWFWLLGLRARPAEWRATALAALPLTLPGLYLGYLHALTPDGPTFEQFWMACLVRRFQVPPPPGLAYLYHVLALVALVVEGRRYGARRMGRAFLLALLLVNLLATAAGWGFRALYP